MGSSSEISLLALSLQEQIARRSVIVVILVTALALTRSGGGRGRFHGTQFFDYPLGGVDVKGQIVRELATAQRRSAEPLCVAERAGGGGVDERNPQDMNHVLPLLFAAGPAQHIGARALQQVGAYRDKHLVGVGTAVAALACAVAEPERRSVRHRGVAEAGPVTVAKSADGQRSAGPAVFGDGLVHHVQVLDVSFKNSVGQTLVIVGSASDVTDIVLCGFWAPVGNENGFFGARLVVDYYASAFSQVIRNLFLSRCYLNERHGNRKEQKFFFSLWVASLQK
mmetsp:Transcript_4258/g.6705  ORF Transcript_4258/g.6705 Transcript_4258/m.6705 type:complete len:281 (+) Transcript_4258:600-1442(+)